MAIIDVGKATGSQKVLINGFQPSFGEIEVTMGGKAVARITAINYADEISAVKDFGTSNFAMVETVGQSNPTCDFEMYKTQATDFINELGTNFTMVKFDISVVFKNPGSPAFKDEILGVRITGVSESLAKGPDPIVVSFTCIPTEIKWSGKSILSRVQP